MLKLKCKDMPYFINSEYNGDCEQDKRACKKCIARYNELIEDKE